MANALYSAGKNGLLTAAFNLTTASMKTTLTNHLVITPNPTTHVNYSDISAANQGPAGGMAITGPTVGSPQAAGVYDAADVQYTALATGPMIESISIYKDIGGNAGPLLVFLEEGTNLTNGFTPNGGNVTISWNPSGIFAI